MHLVWFCYRNNLLLVVQNFRKRGPLTPLPHTPSRCTKGRLYLYLLPCYSGEIWNKFFTFPLSVYSEDADTFLQYTIDKVKLSEISPNSKLRAESLEVKTAKGDFGIGIAVHTLSVVGNYFSILLQILLANLWPKLTRQNYAFVNKEFCVLHVQLNTTIIHLLVQ